MGNADDHSWSERDEERLIEVWQEKPCLYISNLKAYSNRHRKRKALEEIGAFINRSGKYYHLALLFELTASAFFDHRLDMVIE